MEAADDAPAPTPFLTLQRASLWLAIPCFLLGLLATGGCSPFPAGDPAWAWMLHPLLLGLGAAAGALGAARGREIDAARWRALAEPGITKLEREYAHSEAEAERKRAGIGFLLLPAGVGFALASHFSVVARSRVVDLLLVTALAGFALGLWLGGRRAASEGPPTG